MGSIFEELRAAHISIPCYKCGAEPGMKCTTPKGTRLSKPHADRIHEGNEVVRARWAAEREEAARQQGYNEGVADARKG